MTPAAHTDERVVISDDTVRSLIDDQFPDLTDEELGRRYAVEDHVAVRIGDHHGALFPRSAADDHLYARAADLVAPFARDWTFAASRPIGTGVPGDGYPFHWTLVEWISASTAAFVPLHASSARALGDALRQVHAPADPDAPLNPRTAPTLADHVDEWERLLGFVALRGAPENRVLDVDAADALFRTGVDSPVDVEPTWTHGRLEARAIQSDRGRFRSILMWHNFGAGDPAADLGGAATVVPLDMRDQLYGGYGDVTAATAWRAQSHQLLAALRHIEIDDPFLARMAWERLLELGLAHEA